MAEINIYILLYIKYVTNKEIQYTMGNYTQYFVITYKGKEYEKESKSLSCTAGTKHCKYSISQFSSVTQSCPTLCDPMDCPSLTPCPLSTSRVCSNSCPSSWWYYPTTSIYRIYIIRIYYTSILKIN